MARNEKLVIPGLPALLRAEPGIQLLRQLGKALDSGFCASRSPGMTMTIKFFERQQR
ncbi:MAG: hypothetical protein ACREPK_07410 [Rhodanobacteraceae bacterium]